MGYPPGNITLWLLDLYYLFSFFVEIDAEKFPLNISFVGLASVF